MKPKKSLARRDFIRLSAIGASAVVVSSCASSRAIADKDDDKKIIYRTLGRTGIKVPVVSLGVVRPDNSNIVKAALKMGVTHFDTAHSYHEGKHETMLGEVLKEVPRDSFTVGTKVYPGGENEKITQQKFLDMLDESLKRLQLDYVDILYIHSAENRKDAMSEKYMNALEIARKQGKVRFLGVSTHINEPEVLQAAIDTKLYDVVQTAYNFKQEHVKEMNEMLGKATEAGIGIVGMKTMLGGFLDKDRTKPVNGKAALKWVLQNPNIHTTIPGISNYEHLMQNFSVMANLKLTKEEEKDVAFAMAETGMYCTGCKKCLAQCPKNVPIPDLMRAYMYNYGYNHPAKAKETVALSGIKNDPCADCATCAVECTKQFNVAEKISDIVRIKDVPKDFVV